MILSWLKNLTRGIIRGHRRKVSNRGRFLQIRNTASDPIEALGHTEWTFSESAGLGKPPGADVTFIDIKPWTKSFVFDNARASRRSRHRLNSTVAAAVEFLEKRTLLTVITGTNGNDVLNGSSGSDTISGLGGDDRINGLTGDDNVNGNTGNDIVRGGAGNDTVGGGQNNDQVYGDAGNDLISGGLGNDQHWGGTGSDTFAFALDLGSVDVINDWSANEGDRLDLSLLNSTVGNAFAANVITDFGSLVVTQTGADAQIVLPGGQQIVLKNTSVATIQPSQFYGNASIDRRGNDVLQASNAGEQLNGREGNDTITGGVGNDNINGNTGNDIVSGGAGDDTVRGGKDDDQVNGNDGSDQVYGDLGNDTLNGNQGQDYVYGGPGDDVVQGGQGDDLAVHGDEGNDWVYGDLGNDADVNGNQGNDHVYGGDGNDVVRGGQGDDSVSGDAGDDMVHGGLGNNTLIGGSGRDTFIIAEALNVQNTILDFERGSDRIDLTAFAYLSTYDQLVMHQDGANTVIQLSPSNRLIIGGQTPNQIQSTDFVGPWSANKTIYLWLPGLLHDRITQEFLSKGGANATTPTGRPVINVQEYRISGFNPLANPGNLLPYKPFQLIDLRSVSVSQVTWRQDGNDTLVDLDSRFGKVLRLIGVTASQITLRNFLTMNQDEQVAIRSYLADWTDQTQVERYVVPPADQFLTEGNRVRIDTGDYVSRQ